MNERRQLLAIAAIAALVVLAGCSSALPGRDDPGPGNEQGVSLTEDDYPPGVTSDGIVDASTFTENNAQVLREDGYLSQLRIDASVTQEDQTQNVSLIQREAVSPGAEAFFFQAEQSQGNQQSRTTVWSNGTLTLARNEDARQTIHRRVNREQITSQFAAQQVLAQYIGAGTEAYERTEVTRENDSTLVTVIATEYTTQTSRQMPAPENVTEYRSEVTFDTEGRIHDVALRLVAERADRGTIEFNVRYDLVDTGSIDIREPEWIGQALNETSNRSNG